MTRKPSAFILIAPAFLVKQEKQKKTKKKDDNTFDGEEGEKSDKRRGRKEKATPKKKVISPDDEFYDEELFNQRGLVFLESRVGMRRVFVIQHRSEASLIRHLANNRSFETVLAKRLIQSRR